MASPFNAAHQPLSARRSLSASGTILVFKVLQVLVFDMFTPDDTFEVKSRKAILSAYLVATAISIPVRGGSTASARKTHR